MQCSNKSLFLLSYAGKRTGGSTIPVFISQRYRILDQIQNGTEKALKDKRCGSRERKRRESLRCRVELSNSPFSSTSSAAPRLTVGIAQMRYFSVFLSCEWPTVSLEATSPGSPQRALHPHNSADVYAVSFCSLEDSCSCALPSSAESQTQPRSQDATVIDRLIF